jgi:DegV family protein with EDD domain
MNKEKIALLVDSGTDVPAEIMSQYGMYMLPLQIIYKDRTYTDKVDITAEEIYQRLPQEIPSTSLPDGETINKIFDRIKADGYEQVLAVTISSGLSGTYNVVRLMGEQWNDLDIFVLDTKNIGIGAGLQAIRAAELLNEGVTWQELKEQLLQEVVRNKVFFNVATLEYLQKGGRIGLVASILGNALKLNPIISCNDEGIYYTVAKSRGRKKSLDKTVELVKQYIGNHKQFRLAVAQGDALAEAKEMKTRLEQEFPQVKEIFFGQISPALVVHTGPGLLGVGVQLLDETGI